LERPTIQEDSSGDSENLAEEDSENYRPQIPMNNQIGNEFLPNTPVAERFPQPMSRNLQGCKINFSEVHLPSRNIIYTTE
jgi:hypothetical protein